jgi:hypothetical protein
MSLRARPAQRGSTLLLVVVLLGVLSIVGVAAVSLGSQERVNASAKGRRDAMAACARAASMALWAEVAKYGSGYMTSTAPVQEIVLPDGTSLAAPAHYSSAVSDALPVAQIVRTHQVARSFAASTIDLTNKMDAPQSKMGGTAYTVVARCRDAKGRENEVEFTTVLAL